MEKNVAQKAVLTIEVKQMMLSDTANIVALEKAIDGNFFTLRNQLRGQSPTLTQPHYLEAIRKILSLDADAIIHEVVKEDKELHHD